MQSQHMFGALDQWRESYFATVIGAPLEKNPSYRPGASQAPNAIRRASQNIETYSMREKVDLQDLGVQDVGNILVEESDISEYITKLERVIRDTQNQNRIPVLLGGEHTITLSTLGTFSDSLFVVLDAHADLRDEWMGSKYSHACVFRRFLEEIPSNHLIQLGVRAVSKSEAEFAKKEHIRQIGPYEFSEVGPKEIAKDLTDYASSFNSIYVSVDMDGFDPAFAPGVGTPEANGITPREFLEFVHRLEAPIRGFDIVEMVPAIDVSGISAILAARVAFELLTHEAKRNNQTGV